jgi:hypothetical protein
MFHYHYLSKQHDSLLEATFKLIQRKKSSIFISFILSEASEPATTAQITQKGFYKFTAIKNRQANWQQQAQYEPSLAGYRVYTHGRPASHMKKPACKASRLFH